MAQNPINYGVTTVRFAIGASAVVGLSGGPGVIDMIITGLTGGLVHMANASFAVSGSLIAVGAYIQATGLPLSLGGPIPCYFASVAAAEMSVVKMLGAASDIPVGCTIYPY